MGTVHECDRQTDGQTDRITITKTMQRIAHTVKQEAQLLLETVRRESMPRISEMDVEMTT